MDSIFSSIFFRLRNIRSDNIATSSSDNMVYTDVRTTEFCFGYLRSSVEATCRRHISFRIYETSEKTFKCIDVEKCKTCFTYSGFFRKEKRSNNSRADHRIACIDVCNFVIY